MVNDCLQALETAGYKENETLYGAPYDWRLAGDALAQACVKRPDPQRSGICHPVLTGMHPAESASHSYHEGVRFSDPMIVLNQCVPVDCMGKCTPAVRG
jgi:hypothetical protein